MAPVSVGGDPLATATLAAERITGLLQTAIRERGQVAFGLTGGSTPQQLYELLGDPAQPWRARINWSAVHLYWSDERHVPPDHPDSNYGMAKLALLDRVPIPPAQVHRMRGELPDAHDAAREYELLLPDAFDVLLLGVGADAHIGSIFPGSPLLSGPPGASSHRALVAAVWAEHLGAWRITLTAQGILNARAILPLVTGAAKADAVHAALELPLDVSRFPVQLLREADERVEWFVDREAAAKVTLNLQLPY